MVDVLPLRNILALPVCAVCLRAAAQLGYLGSPGLCCRQAGVQEYVKAMIPSSQHPRFIL